MAKRTFQQTFRTQKALPTSFYLKSKMTDEDRIEQQRQKQKYNVKEQPKVYIYIKRKTKNSKPYWTTEQFTGSPSDLETKKISLLRDYQSGRNAGYYISSDLRDFDAQLKRDQLAEKRAYEDYLRQSKYPGATKIKEEITTGAKRLQKQLPSDYEIEEQDYEVPLPVRPPPRSRFYSNPSPQYQESSSFSSQVVPYRPIGRVQSFASYRPVGFGFTPRSTPQPLFKPRMVRF